MSVESTLSRLRELAETMPRDGCQWEERPTFTPSATPQDIASYSRAAGFALPADLREFFSAHDAVVGMSVGNGYWLGGLERLLRSMRRGDFPQEAEGESVAPIATDGGGNAFLISARGNIVRWNHETDRITEVAESLDAFLRKVADDWEAYLTDKRDRPFLA